MASAEPEVTVVPAGPGPSPVSSQAPARLSAIDDAIDDATAGLRPDLGTLSYDELLRHTVETARDVVTADAAYALVADEDGELRVRAAAGVGVSESLFAPSVPAVFADGAAAKSLVTVPFLVDGRVTGVLGAAATSADRFDGTDAAKLQRVADRVAISLERARLSELERKRRGRIGFLAEASELLASTLDQEKTISLIAQLVVPRLAAWCAVLLADEAGELRPEPVYVWHADESLIDPLAGLLAAVGPPEADEAGRSWSLAMDIGPDLVDEAVVLASDAAWCFPLAARGRSLGVVVIGRPRGDRPPREALELAEDLARRAALALDNARLYEQQQLTSQALQRSLLPPELPQIPGIDLSVAHQVAGEGNEVGGDFYDVFPAGPDRWRFAIGDVCGTGPEAAAVTGLARHALRILAREEHDVADVVGRLNDLILEESARGRFLTLLHGEITVLGEAPDPDREGTLFARDGEGASPPVGPAAPGLGRAPAAVAAPCGRSVRGAAARGRAAAPARRDERPDLHGPDGQPVPRRRAAIGHRRHHRAQGRPRPPARRRRRPGRPAGPLPRPQRRRRRRPHRPRRRGLRRRPPHRRHGPAGPPRRLAGVVPPAGALLAPGWMRPLGLALRALAVVRPVSRADRPSRVKRRKSAPLDPPRPAR